MGRTSILLVAALVGAAGCGNTKVNTDAPEGGADANVDAFDLPDAPPGMGTVAVSLAGAGAGTVRSTPPGIDCGTTCATTYDLDSMVTLTATAGTGSQFRGWSGGGCGGTGDCIVTVEALVIVTATFELEQHPLTVMRNGSGMFSVTSNPGGIDCGTDCTETYNHGTTVMLTATPGSFTSFTGWSGDCAGTGACTVTMTGPQTATATFAVQTFVLNVSVIDAQGLNDPHVTSNVGGIDCYDIGGVCSATFDGGTTIILTPHLPANEHFESWQGACMGQGPTCTLTMDGNKSTTLRTACNGLCV